MSNLILVDIRDIYLALKYFVVKIILFLILLSLLIAVGFLIAFFWAVRSGQYDDDYTPSVRILFDDKPADKNS